MIQAQIQDIVARALAEDIGPGDVTSLATIPPNTLLEGQFLAKADGIVAGIEVAIEVFRQVDERIAFTTLLPDGSSVAKGDIIARVQGKGPGILTAERLALNFLQRMSGIATMSHQYQQAAAGTKAIILDTRKTVPGLRLLDKMAVAIGGATNHRHGLYDMIMIKDNHIEAAGSIEAAVARARATAPHLKIEVEVEQFDQLEQALALHVDRIMLDNMPPAMMRQAVEMVAGRVELEASGGITLENVAEVAATGVDFISVGALTHSVKALDISLDVTIVDSPLQKRR